VSPLCRIFPVRRGAAGCGSCDAGSPVAEFHNVLLW
jgi:hypothetical protein